MRRRRTSWRGRTRLPRSSNPYAMTSRGTRTSHSPPSSRKLACVFAPLSVCLSFCRDGQQRREAFFYPSRPFSKLCRPQELKALYAVIDAMEQAVNAAADATATAASRLDVLTAASAEGSAPNGLAKVARFFTRGAGSNASRVADAPVTLPPYTPAELDVDALLGSLAAAVGDAAELAAARGHLRGPLPPFEEAEGETGADVDEGTAETEVAAGGGAAKEAVYGGGADDL